MKHKILLSLIATLLVTFSGFAQKEFKEGKIVYTITYPDMDFDAQTAAMMPSVMTLYIKGDKTRMEMKMGMGMSNVTITDAKAKTVTSLIDAMGQKYAMKLSEEDINKEAEEVPEIEINKTDQTKEIAGLSCQVTKLVFKDKKGERIDSEICLSKEFSVSNANWSNPQYKDVDGLMLEYEMEQGQMKMKLKAKSVKEEAVADSMFEIPAEYEHKTLEEMMQMR
jgi:hypothetical protein